MEGMRVPPIIDPITNKVTGDILFNGFMAVAMACHKGTSFPANPVDGQWFYHTGATVNCLFMYMGSSWRPIMSLGALTLYVDSASGSDAIGKGYGSGANACATVQYAFNLIPPIVGGNVIVNITAGTYSETPLLKGKTLAGNYTITIQGTKSILDSGLAAGVGSLQGTDVDYSYQYASVVRGSGTWTANQRQNKWVEFTSGVCNGEYRTIDSNTTTKLTIYSRWVGGAPASGDTFNVFEPGTTIPYLQIGSDQKGVIVSDINLSQTTPTSSKLIGPCSEVTLRRCKGACSYGTYYIRNGAVVTLVECFISGAQVCISQGARCYVAGGKYYNAGTPFMVCENSFLHLGDGAIIDCNDKSGSEGVFVRGHSQVSFEFSYHDPAISPRVTIRNCVKGIYCEWLGFAEFVNCYSIMVGDDIMPNSNESATATLANKLVDTSVDFTAIGVAVGDKVVNLETNNYALVTGVDSATQLSISADIMYSGGDYRILKASSLNTTDFSTADGGVIDLLS